MFRWRFATVSGYFMTDFYFAYGSNMNPRRMAGRGMRYRSSQAASLSGWQLAFNKRAHGKQGIAYANIVEQPAGQVEGVLYELVSADEITRMDPYEGHPLRYQRKQLMVRTEHSAVTAWVYLATPGWQQEGLLPERDYLNHLLSGRPWLSLDYFSALLRTPCYREPAPQT